jgi:hypothetical protein
MSFRQYGGTNYASRNNIIKNHYTNASNLSVMNKVGQPDSIINVDSGLNGIGGDITFKQNNGVAKYGIIFSDGSPQYTAITSTSEYWKKYADTDKIYYTDTVFVGVNPLTTFPDINDNIKFATNGNVFIGGIFNVGYTTGEESSFSLFNVEGLTGNTSISGTLTVTGNVTLSGSNNVIVGYAKLASPTFTGTPTAPNYELSGNSQIATTDYVSTNYAPLASPTFTGTVTAQTFSGTATTATNIAGGTAWQVPYQTTVSTTSFTTGGTLGQVLTSSGTSAPTWTTPSVATSYWSSSNSTDIYYNSGNVGIGTTTPTKKLQVVGSDALINGLTVGTGGGSLSSNTAFGVNALSVNILGYNNTAIGVNALAKNTGPKLIDNLYDTDNTAVGVNALTNNTTGYWNTAVGLNALYNNTDGFFNTAIGLQAGYFNSSNQTSCKYCTFIGTNTYCLDGNNYSYSTAIGNNAQIKDNNQIVLGGFNYTDNKYPNVYIPGTVTADGSVTAASYNAPSDYRIKENVELIGSKFTIDNLRPVTYTNILSKKQDIGFIAHELQEHFPFLVTGEKDGPVTQSVNYIGLISLLVKEIQDLKQDIKMLKSKC